MNTNNIISTPDITGNIGTCDTKQTTITTQQGVIISQKKTIVTNSCTGQIVGEYSYTDYSSVGISGALIAVGFMIIVATTFGLHVLLESKN